MTNVPNSRLRRSVRQRLHDLTRPRWARPFFFGVTRFSVAEPGSPSWQLTRGQRDTDAYLQALYAPERMEARCHIFCDVTAPLLQEQAEGRKYRHLVLYSSVMPQQYQDRLREAAKRYPVLQLERQPEQPVPVKALLGRRFANSRSRWPSMVYVFRLDDDDVLGVNFLNQVEPFLVPAHHGFAVSLTHGYVGSYQDGRYHQVQHHRRPLSSIGIGAIGSWDPGRGVLDVSEIRNHPRTDQRRTVLYDGTQRSWLRTVHPGQDTAGTGPAQLDPKAEAAGRDAALGVLPTLRQVW